MTLFRIEHNRSTGDIDTVFRTVSEVSAKQELRRIADSYEAGGWSTSIDQNDILTAVVGDGRITTEYRIRRQD